MNQHETAAMKLLAHHRSYRHDQCTLVKAPRARTTYLWADPVSGRTGTCRFGLKNWTVPPEGIDPILFEKPIRRRLVAQVREELTSLGLIDLAESLCASYRVSVDDVLGDCRESTLPQVRARLWGTIRLATGFSTTRLGEIFGRDPTSIRAGIDGHYPEAMGTVSAGRMQRRVKAVSVAA